MTVARCRVIGVLMIGLMVGLLAGCSGRKVVASAGDHAAGGGTPPASTAQQSERSERAERSERGQPAESGQREASTDAPAVAPAEVPAEPAPALTPQTKSAETIPSPSPVEEVRESVPAAPAGVGAATAKAAPSAPIAPMSPPAQPTPPMAEVLAAALADVYFDFDRFAIRTEAKKVLEANARMLKSKDGWKLLIEGHCDERGTADYNLVLAERRAQSVKRYLGELGLPDSRVQVISYGKEKPFCSEHSDDCWQQNRRAHFVLK
jgi:peptidoglycan-associated lipoprotein